MKNLLSIYRACGNEIDPSTYRSGRPKYFSKFKSWDSFYNSFSPISDVHVVWDGPQNELFEHIQKYGVKIEIIDSKSNQGSLNQCFLVADKEKGDYENLFFSEDDHFYLPNAGSVLLEGLEKFYQHFIATGDHPDRYRKNNGDIIQVDEIFVTPRSHWRIAESYVFSFGVSAVTFDVFRKALFFYNDSGAGAVRDRDFFRYIITCGYRLFTPIPACSTHMIINDLSPVIDWEAEVNK
jgi:hypothetical protein